jgi:hypothetical protein
MGRHHWFRSTDWNEQIEAEFFRRFKRARSGKAQYLTIQALTLVDTGRPELAPTALNLIELFFQEHGDPGMGVVGMSDADVQIELEQLAAD